MKELTAQAVFDEAFKPGRAPRSEAYKQGVLASLRVRIDRLPKVPCPYVVGTADSDAFFAGVEEGRDLSPEDGQPGLLDVYAYLDEIEQGENSSVQEAIPKNIPR